MLPGGRGAFERDAITLHLVHDQAIGRYSSWWIIEAVTYFGDVMTSDRLGLAAAVMGADVAMTDGAVLVVSMICVTTGQALLHASHALWASAWHRRDLEERQLIEEALGPPRRV
jgi:hypothetical protein